MVDNKRTLMIFGTTRLSAMLAKGNVWYVTHYREAFDQVICVYLVGARSDVPARRDTHLVSIGSSGFIASMLAAPARLLQEDRRVGATHYLTADILTSWWTASLLRLFRRAQVIVMPVCTPDEIYKNSGRTFSGLPKFIEGTLIWLSFATAQRILVAENSPATRRWLASSAFSAKVVVVKATPEELPSIDFLERIETLATRRREAGDKWVLTYVGRLEHEKHVECLVEVAAHLKSANLDFEIRLVGNGTAEASMRQKSIDLGVDAHMKFLGFQIAPQVAEHLAASDMFLSTLTGTALKEAALAKLPVIAFAIDYVPDLLTHETDVMLVPVDDARAMATAVRTLIEQPGLRHRIATNLHALAAARWTPSAAKAGLTEAFAGL
ncbi:MAG: glycosyltransferase family 4 protein [Hyphomicrobiaceae bacterium]